MQTEKLISRHPLANGLTLELWDLSRPVAGDRWQVVLEARLTISVAAATLPPELRDREAEIFGALGSEIRYSQKDERNFIAASELPETRKEMTGRLLALASYLGHPEFARRFIRKKYDEYLDSRRCRRPD